MQGRLNHYHLHLVACQGEEGIWAIHFVRVQAKCCLIELRHWEEKDYGRFCALPSRLRKHPYLRRCLSKALRFTQPSPSRESPLVEFPEGHLGDGLRK